MATAVITFDLDNPDDLERYNRCNSSLDMALALFEMTVNLRGEVDHKCAQLHEQGGDYDKEEVIYEEIERIMKRFNIDLDRLCT